ncbi:hypothetical protein MUK42_03516 [Musa troglodytarum]|nr:hypothetical protein MUK42_03516 [Musa troglodytarum]
MLMGAGVRIRKDDGDSAIRTHHFTSQRWFAHASPTLSNAGTPGLQVSDAGLVLFFYKLQLFLHWWIFC